MKRRIITATLIASAVLMSSCSMPAAETETQPAQITEQTEVTAQTDSLQPVIADPTAASSTVLLRLQVQLPRQNQSQTVRFFLTRRVWISLQHMLTPTCSQVVQAVGLLTWNLRLTVLSTTTSMTSMQASTTSAMLTDSSVKSLSLTIIRML